MHYLQGAIDIALGKVVVFLVPAHPYKSVHDLFNPRLFHDCLLAILSNIPELSGHLDELTLAASVQQPDTLNSSSGFVNLRMRNFTAICESMSSALVLLGQGAREVEREGLFRMVKEFELDELEGLLEQLFELVIRNRAAVEFITELPAEDQAAIKDFLQRGKARAEALHAQHAAKVEEESELRKLEEENAELRHLVNSKESDIHRMSVQVSELQDAIQQLRQLQSLKENKIQGLKRRLSAYQETDTLFQEKDEEILRLNRAVAELQMANRLMAGELAGEKVRWEQRITELQGSNGELQSRSERLGASLELVSRQKEEIEQSNKRVIANLKDKIKSLTERVGEVQSQLVETRISRELRQRDFSELLTRYQSLRSQSSLIQRRQSREQKLPGSLSASYGGARECLRLGEELTELDKLQENAFEQEIMMFESGEDNVKRVQEIVAQNLRLRERLAAEGRGGREENDKLRKKLVVMRKRNEELEMQRKEELDLLVGAFEHCLRGRNGSDI